MDSTGRLYTAREAAVAAARGTLLEGGLAPDATNGRQTGFEVPKGLDELVFVFDDDLLVSGKAFVKLR